MLTREQCLNDIQENIATDREINLRNVVRSLADYARVALNELGTYVPGYQVVSKQQIINRFDLLSPRIPELAERRKLFKSIDDLRQRVDHDEWVVPEKTFLKQLFEGIKEFNMLLEAELAIRPPVETLYRCEIKWDGKSQDTNDPIERKKVLDQADIWVSNAKKLAAGNVEELMMEGQVSALLLKLKEGEVQLSLLKIASRTPVSADIMMESTSAEALDSVLSGKEQWHWDIRWKIPQKMDLDKVAKRAKQMAGRDPDQANYENDKLVGVGYRLSTDEEMHLRVGLATERKNDGMLIVHVGCYGSLDKGFIVASKVFSAGLFLAALYGEISTSEFRKKVNEG